jgi:HTH-type transcriptional regulator / antitoxin HipB
MQIQLLKQAEETEMSDLKRYVGKRKKEDLEFATDFEFRIGVIIRGLRKKAGLTQDELAKKLHTQKSAISRIENQSGDIHMSTLFKIADALGKHVHIDFR